jgi:hypothetical protein
MRRRVGLPVRWELASSIREWLPACSPERPRLYPRSSRAAAEAEGTAWQLIAIPLARASAATP